MTAGGITFDDFWKAYGLKRDRQRAERAWNRLSKRDRKAAYDGIAAYRDDCLRDGISMMYAQGYLNNRRWEDEHVPSPSAVRARPETAVESKEPEIW